MLAQKVLESARARKCEREGEIAEARSRGTERAANTRTVMSAGV